MFFKLIKFNSLIKFIFICFLLYLFILLFNSIYTFITTKSYKSITTSSNDYIKWVDFNVSYEAMKQTADLDINSHLNDNPITYNWIELLSYLACIYGGDFNKFNTDDLNNLVSKLNEGKTIDQLSSSLQYYDYYFEAYSTILKEFIGDYSSIKYDKENNAYFEETYGVKAFSPISNDYYFTHYKDFGSSRSYGFSRTHLGNDLMGSIGTPIVAIESGIIENIGWNQYGGWRIGIRSFDSSRYYYYAHLRKDTPYAEGLEKGSIIQAGDVIGYLGMTGYSLTENVNNVNIPHLHLGMQLIFDESQINTPNEIWIDVYAIIEFLHDYN